jgi:hypothetical protein
MSDDWNNAVTAFLASSQPTLKPLADMIRGNEPIPQGVRDMLATMLDPDAEAYLYFKLKLVSTENKRKNVSKDLEAMEVSADFAKRPEKTREEAAEKTGEAFGIDPRTVFKHKARHAKLLSWIRGDK